MPMSKNASTASCMMRVTSTAKWGGEKEGGNRERGEEGSCLGGWGSVWGSKLSGGGEQGSPPYSALPPSHRCTSQLQCPPYPPPPSHFPPAANYVTSLCPTRSNMAAAAFSRAGQGRPRQAKAESDGICVARLHAARCWQLARFLWLDGLHMGRIDSRFSGLMAFAWVDTGSSALMAFTWVDARSSGLMAFTWVDAHFFGLMAFAWADAHLWPAWADALLCALAFLPPFQAHGLRVDALSGRSAFLFQPVSSSVTAQAHDLRVDAHSTTFLLQPAGSSVSIQAHGLRVDALSAGLSAFLLQPAGSSVSIQCISVPRL